MDSEIIIRDSDEAKRTHPSVLYKYRDWNNPYHQKILIDNKIYFSAPCEFEDKMDCNVPEKFPEKRELYEIFLEKSIKENPSFTKKEHCEFAEYWKENSPLANPEELQSVIDEFNKKFNARFGVLSVTADSENLEMWNKYADFGRGICIGFDTRKLFSISGGGGEVIYGDLPVIDFVNDDFTVKHIKNILFKEEKWSFEKEYRLNKIWPNKITKEDRNISLPADCIVEIILGKNISKENETEIIDIVKLKYKNVKIRKSKV